VHAPAGTTVDHDDHGHSAHLDDDPLDDDHHVAVDDDDHDHDHAAASAARCG